MKRLYCGGSFCFDITRSDYRKHAENDFRVRLLGSFERLLIRQSGTMVGNDVEYIGPFYVETEDVPYGLNDEIIVRNEMEMIESCTDAVFLLDDGCCPGTVAELILASQKGKDTAVFYINRGEGEETESRLHTPCWFPIIMSQKLNPNTRLFSCSDREDAIKILMEYVSLL